MHPSALDTTARHPVGLAVEPAAHAGWMSLRRKLAQERLSLLVGEHLGGLADGANERQPLIAAQLLNLLYLRPDLRCVRLVRSRQRPQLLFGGVDLSLRARLVE